MLGLADLGALARTRPGQYVLDHMPPSAQAVRLAGDAVMGSRGLPPQPGPAAPRRGPSRGRLVSCGVAAAVQAPMTPNTANAYRAARYRRTASSGRAEIIQVTISRGARSAVHARHAAYGLRRAVTSRCVTTLPGRRPTGAFAGGCPAAHEGLGQLARKYSPMARWTTSETLTCSWAARVSSARSSSTGTTRDLGHSHAVSR